MPVWKYTNKNVKKEDAKKSLNAIKNACFHCENHNNSCPISRAAGEVKAITEGEE